MTGGMAELIEHGVITNALKPIDAGVSVAGLLAGGAAPDGLCAPPVRTI